MIHHLKRRISYMPLSDLTHMGTFNNHPFHIHHALSVIFCHRLLHVTGSTQYENNITITTATSPASPGPSSGDKPFKPGAAIIVGILTTIFLVAILLLIYVRHCERRTYHSDNNRPPSRLNSGIERRVIESLPIFKFSSLTGQKDGLECAVCLNRFDPDEVLRLLPKCKHAFHVECVDTWLDAHSTCPLCRYRVDPEDVLLVLDHNYCCNDDNVGHEDHVITSHSRRSNSSRRSSSLEIIVENPGKLFQGRASLDSWNSRRVRMPRDLIRAKSLDAKRSSSSSSLLSRRRKSNEAINTSRRWTLSRGDDKQHRLEHRIIISSEDVEAPRRWSDVHETEMLYLRSGLILGGGGGNDGGREVTNQRSVSETTVMSRFRRSKNSNSCGDRRDQKGVVMKRWLSWISKSKQEHDEQQKERSTTTVQSPASSSGVLCLE